MANTLVLNCRAFRPSYHPTILHKSPRHITFQCHRPFYMLPLNPTTLPKPKPKPKPAFVFKHDTIVPIFPSSKIKTSINNHHLRLFLDVISGSIKVLKIPVTTVVLTCVLMCMHGNAYPAWGASGGRMGGRSSSSRSSSSRSSSSRSSSSRSSSRSSSSGSSSSSRSSSSSSRPSSTSSSGVTSGGSEISEISEGEKRVFWCVFIIFIVFLLAIPLMHSYEPNSIVKIQIGLLGTAKSLQSELNRIALTADTSTSEGISLVLRETVKALLKHREYFISAYSSVNRKNSIAAGDKLFQRLSVEERAKFDEETLVNVDNIKKHVTRSKDATGINNEFIVVTILVAANGKHKLPTIKGNVELTEALQMLESIPRDQTIAAEVLWTPQEENDTLSEQKYHQDYPLLKPLEDSLSN